MTVLLDSWAWIEFLKEGPKVKQIEKYITIPHDLIISSINIAEIQGFLLRHGNESLLIYITERCAIIPVTEDIAILAARIKHESKLHLSDAILLATARLQGAALVTGDAHFKGKKDVVYLGA